MTKKEPVTPVRSALRERSPLRILVEDGLIAVKKTDRDCFDDKIRADFADSLDVDKAFERGHENENRWDYLLGHAPSGEVIAVEPHSAKQDEVSAVIRKRTAARQQLGPHLCNGAKISKWLWVASGKVHFANTEKTKLQLDQNGIELVGKKVLSKHLPSKR
ncbi:MAG TPA: hypothetical protein PK156_11540 [Polyangium sp.]|nr:hypothetical protein [Polyangium sp.]